jgi:hypothetical protein
MAASKSVAFLAANVPYVMGARAIYEGCDPQGPHPSLPDMSGVDGGL